MGEIIVIMFRKLLRKRGRQGMECTKCGCELTGNEKFCPDCGTEIVKKCLKCGTELTNNEKFCPICGTKVQGTESGNENIEADPLKIGNGIDDISNAISLKQEEPVAAKTTLLKDGDRKKDPEAEIVGKNIEYYQKQFEQIRSGDKGKINWASFLLGPFHAAYRNVWKEWMRGPGIPLIIAAAVSIIGGGTLFVSGNLAAMGVVAAVIGISQAVCLVLQILFAIRFNRIYLNHVMEKINKKDFKPDGSIIRSILVSVILGTILGISQGIYGMGSVSALLFTTDKEMETELSFLLSSDKKDILEFANKNKIKDENNLDMYIKEGIIFVLDEQGKIDMLSLDAPGYSLYGMSVGDLFSMESDGKRLAEYGYEFLDEYEGKIIYGILSSRDTQGGDCLIAVSLDTQKIIAKLEFLKTGAQDVLDGRNDGLLESNEYGFDDMISGEDAVRQNENDAYVDNFSVEMLEGTWWDLQSQRCYMNIYPLGENQFEFNIHWGSGAHDGTEWYMTAYYDSAARLLNYQDGQKVYIHYTETGEEQVETVYTDGTGRFFFSDGYLYWTDDKEHDGDDCYFEKENGVAETYDYSDYSAGVTETESYYEWDLPVDTGSYLYVVNCNASITLRNAPATTAAEITQIPLYSAVEYIGMGENGFCQIAYNGVTGYVLPSYLDVYEPQVWTGVKCIVVNCHESITLRTSISSKDKEICQIPLGTVVDYIDTADNGYILVNYNGVMGYAQASYLEIQ